MTRLRALLVLVAAGAVAVATAASATSPRAPQGPPRLSPGQPVSYSATLGGGSPDPRGPAAVCSSGASGNGCDRHRVRFSAGGFDPHLYGFTLTVSLAYTPANAQSGSCLDVYLIDAESLSAASGPSAFVSGCVAPGGSVNGAGLYATDYVVEVDNHGAAPQPFTARLEVRASPVPFADRPVRGFRRTVLVDPDTTSGARIDARLASDGGSTVAALVEHISRAQTVPTAFPLWESTDGGSRWPRTPLAISPPTCASGEIIGYGKPSVPRPRLVYTAQNCGTVNTVMVSRDGGPFAATPEPVTGADDDEGYVTADPSDPRSFYVVSHQLGTLATAITVSSTHDGGTTYTQSAVNAPCASAEVPGCATQVQGQAPYDVSNFYTPVLIDPRNPRHLTLFWVAGKASALPCGAAALATAPWHFFDVAWVAASDDAGVTWHKHEIYDPDPDTTCTDVAQHNTIHELDNSFFPEAATDAAGNLYLVFSELLPGRVAHQRSHVMLMTSTDGGRTFTRPVQVDRGTAQNVTPALAVGAPGHVAIAWEAANAPDQTSPWAAWAVMLTESRDGLRPSPRFSQQRVTGLVHTGSLCPSFPNCDGALPQGTEPDDANAIHLYEHATLGLALNGCGRSTVFELEDTRQTSTQERYELPVVSTQRTGGIGATPGRCARR